MSALRACAHISKNICQARAIILVPYARYAKKVAKVGKGKAAAAGAPQPKKHYEDIETDPVKLTTMLCGGNIMKEGTDPVLKEDHEYPEWLWGLRLERTPIPLEELDPDTKPYWKRLRSMEIKRTRLLEKTNYKWRNF